jgi:hypothetical protein
MNSVLARLCCLPLLLCLSSPAEQTATPPAAPSVTQQTDTINPRSLSGTVVDSDGALVAGAKVTLTTAASPNGSKLQASTIADANGHFSFDDVPVGEFTLTVTANGLQGTAVSGSLNADESLELPPIELRIASDSTEIQVSSLTEHEIAALQLKQEEKQRLMGMVPNFYVTYDWKAAALSTKQKYQLAARSLVDPATFVIVGGFAGIEQGLNAFSGYGQGAAGYGKRFGAGMANASIGTILGGAVFPELFHQDPRYFYKGTGSVHSRVLYALSTAVIQRGDNGKWQPAYSGIAADFTSGALSNLYYPASDQTGVGLTLENGFVEIGTNALGNLLQEFVLKKLSTGIKLSRSSQPQSPQP